MAGGSGHCSVLCCTCDVSEAALPPFVGAAENSSYADDE